MKKYILIVGLVAVFGGATTVIAQGPDGPGGPIFTAIAELQERVFALEAATTITELSCTDGQVAKYNDGIGDWECADDEDTTYTAGNELLLIGTQFNVDEGSGSGLDADLLDGMDSTDFLSTAGGEIDGDLTVNGDLDVYGEVTVGSINYRSARTHYLSIGQYAFQPTEARQYQLAFEGTGALSELSASLVAPVYLPDGAVVRQITCYFYDVYTDGDLTCDLKHLRLSDGGVGHMAGTDSDTDTGAVERSCCSGLNATINNSSYAYYIIVTPDPLVPGWPDTGPDMGIKGVVLQYRLSEAP